VRRRAFLTAAIAAAVARPAPATAGIDRRAIVAAAAIPPGGGDLSPALDAAMSAITGARGDAAWGAICSPNDRVAIKLNCLGGPRLSPSPRLVDAIVRGIASAGVRQDAIVMFDRTSRELERAGFPERREAGAVRCFGTDALKGGGYGDSILEHRSIGSFFTRILTDHATILINVGVCKDHDLSGVSAGLKNLYGLIHNPNRYHANGCDPFLADLADHPAVRPKLRLTIVDAAAAQCHGGPAHNPAYTFRPGKLLVTRDGLAADVIAGEWIEAERARRGLPSLAADKREPTWIATAANLGVGVGDRSRIDLREVGG